MPEKVTYADSGVDRDLRAKAKTSLRILTDTYKHSGHGKILQLPYGNLLPIKDRYLDLAIEGVGTKVLLAQLADKHDTIGIDGVAMVVNDVIRSGATPLALVDNIHAQESNPILVKEWMNGLVRGAHEAQCAITGGEIGDVADLIKGIEEQKGFDMVVACIGEVEQEQVISGKDIKPDDILIGFRSSGIHSNGISLARKVLFKKWGGEYDAFDTPDGLDRELILEVLEPTRIYVKPLHAVMKHHRIKGAVHITGDAYLKLGKLMEFSDVGFEVTNIKPQSIFHVIEEAASSFGGISDEEMLRTFNMGWGFAIVVDKKEADEVLDILERQNVEAERIGMATSKNSIVTIYKGKRIALS